MTAVARTEEMTNGRAIAGYRRRIRAITDAETARLVELRHAIVAAHVAADDYVIELYELGVSQQAIADVLGVTQGAVHQRVLRHYEWLRRRRESGDEVKWYRAGALQPRPNRGGR